MKSLLLVLAFSMTASVFAQAHLTDEAGEKCLDKASRISKQYLEVADVSENLHLNIFKEDVVVATTFKNTTPGSYDQLYVSKVVINNDQKLVVTFSGEFNCEDLKVKSIIRIK